MIVLSICFLLFRFSELVLYAPITELYDSEGCAGDEVAKVHVSSVAFDRCDPHDDGGYVEMNFNVSHIWRAGYSCADCSSCSANWIEIRELRRCQLFGGNKYINESTDSMFATSSKYVAIKNFHGTGSSCSITTENAINYTSTLYIQPKCVMHPLNSGVYTKVNCNNTVFGYYEYSDSTCQTRTKKYDFFYKCSKHDGNYMNATSCNSGSVSSSVSIPYKYYFSTQNDCLKRDPSGAYYEEDTSSLFGHCIPNSDSSDFYSSFKYISCANDRVTKMGFEFDDCTGDFGYDITNITSGMSGGCVKAEGSNNNVWIHTSCNAIPGFPIDQEFQKYKVYRTTKSQSSSSCEGPGKTYTVKIGCLEIGENVYQSAYSNCEDEEINVRLYNSAGCSGNPGQQSTYPVNCKSAGPSNHIKAITIVGCSNDSSVFTNLTIQYIALILFSLFLIL